MFVDLKPCPFCKKSVAELTTVLTCEACANFDDDEECPACYDPKEEDNCLHFVVCSVINGGCGASTGWYLNGKKAQEAWNRREDEP